MTPNIFTIIPRETLKDVLTSFSECTGIPISAVDSDGTVVERIGDYPEFCSYYEQYIGKDQYPSCKSVKLSAGLRASELGESYIFSCPANLNNIVFPLMSKNTLFGTVFVGPFIMDDPDSLLLLDIARENAVDNSKFLDLYNAINEVKIVPPHKVTQLARLLYYLMCAMVADSSQQLQINKGKLYQQSRINESIQRYKEFDDPEISYSSYPYAKEKELIARVKTGNAYEAKAILNDLLGYTLFAEAGDLTNVKARATELSALLSRAAIEGGAPADVMLKINNEFLRKIKDDMNIDDLCYCLQEVTEVFADSLFGAGSIKNNETVRKAIMYIARNYSSKITLETVATYVGLNPSYFSSYFKQICGASFKDYLNMVRIEEAKRLLTNTDESILDIALSIGFDNQSYFTKVFKKYTGVTPNKFR